MRRGGRLKGAAPTRGIRSLRPNPQEAAAAPLAPPRFGSARRRRRRASVSSMKWDAHGGLARGKGGEWAAVDASHGSLMATAREGAGGVRTRGVGRRQARAHRMAGALRIWRVPRTAGVTGIQACSSRRPARRGKRERNGVSLACLAWCLSSLGTEREMLGNSFVLVST